jgi:sigma-B regulation protein RsbU (phosphoserine phosphatase)
LPYISGLDYGGDCQPAGGAGGDFFDLRRLPGNELAVSVGEVSGHGIDAAILLSVIQAFLRGLTGSGAVEVVKVIEQLNQVVCQVAPPGICATLFLAYVDPRRRELRYVSAGHEPPLLWRKRTGRVQRLTSAGTVLGLSGRTSYEQRTIGMDPGDILVAFTDGIAEATDGQGRVWGEDGILSVLRRCHDARSPELVAEILESARRFADSMTVADDRTAVVVRLAEPAKHPIQDEEAVELACAAAA